MSKKRAKSGAGSAGPQKWEQAIVSSSFCEEGWNAAVVWIVGNKIEDYTHINTLAASVNSGARKLFTHITKDELYEQVNELGNPKNKGKVKEVPANSEICEPCRNHLENGEDIPLPLLAKLIKFRLLDAKQKDLKRRDTEKKAPAGGAGGADKGAKGGKGGKADKDRAKSAAKGAKGGGKKTPEPPSPKGETKLRRRGEEDTDSKYIDDEPDDGPEHYIFVSGFHEPLLIMLLAELSIHVDCIIKVLSDDYQILEPSMEPAPDAEPPTEERLQDTRATTRTNKAEEEARQKAIKSKKDLKIFWRDTITQLQKAPEGSKLNDLARLEYIVKTGLIPENLEDVEQKAQFGLALFEDVACLVYDLLDARRQWQNFLTNLHLLHVPVLGGADATAAQEAQSQQSATPGPQTGAGTLAPPLGLAEGEGVTVKPDIDLRFYNEMMDTVPQESISVPLVLHAMLDQVVAWEEDKEPPSETPHPPRPDGLDETLAEHITHASFKLALTNEEIKVLATEFNANKSSDMGPKQPLLIDHNDKITWRLNHLNVMNGFDHKKVEEEMLVRMPLMSALRLPRPSAKAARERAARLQELLHFCSNAALSQAEVDHAFKQFVFENMEQTTVDESGSFNPPTDKKATIPWDDPYPLFANQPEVEDIPVEEVKSDPVVQNTGPVEADKLAKQLEALQPTADAPTPSPPPRPASASSGRASRSRGKKKRSKSPTQVAPAAASPVPQAEKSPRPNSGGILKSRSGSRSNLNSRRSSVHFERNDDGAIVAQPGDVAVQPAPPAETPRSVEELMATVLEGQRRNLDQWCFAEHFEPNVLKQVLREASHTHPYVDTYYHKRDQLLFVVLHNPHNAALHSTVSWQTNLHSNVGFRNYLEHVAAAIEDWTRVEEAKYEGEMLAKEVERIQKEADSSSRPNSGAGKGKGRDRSKSPKKASSRTGRSSSRGSSGERPSSTNMFIREGSLKAQKMEIDAQRAEIEEAEKAKGEKRARSAAGKKGKEEEKKDKKANSRSSSKSRLSKEVLDTEPAPEADSKTPEPQWPFMGYDVGNNMIHVGGTITTMFPADGGQIRVNKTEYVQGTVSVSTAVLKDGHQFMVHVLDPRIDPIEDHEDAEEAAENTVEKADEEQNEKQDAMKPEVGRFGSLTAVFNDGMSLAFSTYGPTGSPDEAKKELMAPAALQTPRSPSPGPKSESPAKSRKDKGKGSTPEPLMAVEDEIVEEEVVEEPVIPQHFQQMFVTCPDGLYVSFQLESALGIKPESEEKRLLTVRQLYPFKTGGQQPCESLRRTALEESCRLITSEGVVIRYMADGSTMLLYPDGKVSVLEALPAPPPSDRAESPQRAGSAKSGAETPTKQKGRGRKSTQPAEATVESADNEGKKPKWITTLPDGNRLANTIDGAKVDVKNALVCQAVDPHTRQTLVTREDHVMSVTHPDGTIVVEHADGTRITSYSHEMETQVADESQKETGEMPEVQRQEVRFVHVECPGFATVKFDTSSTECSIEFGTGTVINAYPSGSYDVYHHDGGYLQAETDGTAVYTPRPNNDIEVHNPDLDMRYLFRHFADSVIETTDNEGNQFTVRHTGDTNVNLSGVAGTDVVSAENQEDGEKEAVQVRQVVHYKQHAPRLFLIQGDGGGTELLRYQDVAEYIATAEDDPTTAILMDPLQDYPGVVGITIMKPQARGFSDLWLRPYSQSTVIPSGLTSRDLKTLPPREYVKEGPTFGTNVGQGLMVGSIVRSESRQPVLKCPNILEVRQLLQYKPVSQDLRDSLQSGMREYAKFVCGRQEESSCLLVQDPRTEAEKLTAAKLAAAARVVSEENAKAVYEKTTTKPIPEPCPTPQPKRSRADWERDMREVEEEKANLKTLRDHDVPKYFDSELGKAFLLAQWRDETEAPDIDQLTKQLAAGALRPTSETATTPDNQIPDTSVNASQQSHISDRSDINTSPEGPQQRASVMESPYIRDLGSTPSAVRPGNPTPAHAAGQGSPAPLRPKNPTPAHGTSMALVVDRPGAPTPKEGLGRNVPSETPSSTHAPHVYPSIPEQPQEERTAFIPHPPSDDGMMEPMSNRTLHVNVIGVPRTEPVTVPAYINQTGRPNAVSNTRFGQVEEPVRRQVFTSSVAGATAQGAHTLSRMRGFELLPNYVDFGVLKEGNTYAFPVHLKNTGIDACRFKIKQPPPSTGLRVLFRPGPVAAGMKAELMLEIYAIAVGVTGDCGIGKMSHNVEVITETDHLYLPVQATILTAHEYDNRGKNAPQGSRNAGVKWVSNRPPAGQGIIRPRKTIGGKEMIMM